MAEGWLLCGAGVPPEVRDVCAVAALDEAAVRKATIFSFALGPVAVLPVFEEDWEAIMNICARACVCVRVCVSVCVCVFCAFQICASLSE